LRDLGIDGTQDGALRIDPVGIGPFHEGNEC